MKKATLKRYETSNQGTFGVLSLNGFSCRTGELPFYDNMNDISCIPKGTYKAKLKYSFSKGWVFEILNVPGRDHVLIHSGNFCGDVESGYLTDSEGCILLGSGIGFIEGQKAVLNSRKTMKKFYETMHEYSFQLEITEDYS